jgi:uncharacterized small protein (DUF1192 family)
MKALDSLDRWQISSLIEKHLASTDKSYSNHYIIRGGMSFTKTQFDSQRLADTIQQITILAQIPETRAILLEALGVAELEQRVQALEAKLKEMEGDGK